MKQLEKFNLNFNRSDGLVKAFTALLTDPFLFIAYDYRVEGRENLPRQGPAVIVSKHQSWIDILVAMNLTPQPATYMAKFQMVENMFGDFPGTLLCKAGETVAPFTAWLVTTLGVIPIDRDNPVKMVSSFKLMKKKLLEDKDIIIFYPEGYFIKNRMGPFKPGLIKLLLRFQKQSPEKIKFIPLGISYGSKRNFRKKLIARIGQPMEFECEDREAPEKLYNAVESLTDFTL